MNKNILILALIAAVSLALILPPDLCAEPAVKIRVKVDRVNIRKAAIMTAPAVGQAEKGQVFSVVEKSGEWFLIQLPDGTPGYIHSFTVEEVTEEKAPPAEKPKAAANKRILQVTAVRANIRKEAALTAPLIRTADKGETFPIIEKSGEWYLIELPDGVNGCIHAFTAAEISGGEAAPGAKPAEAAALPAEKPAVKTVVPEKKAETVAAPPVEKSVEKPPVPEIKQAEEPARVKTPRNLEDSFSMFLLRAGYFISADSAYTDVYKNGLVYGGEVRIGGKKLAGWLEANYRAETGALTYTQEETKVSVLAVEAGVLYRFEAGNIHPYAGAGVGYFMFSEKNEAIGEAKKGGIGFCALGGASYFLGKGFVLDARVKFDFCSMKPADFDIQIGGFTIGIGAGYRW